MSMCNAFVAVGLLAVVATGCGSGASAPAKSPKEVFDRASAAAKSEKYADILPLFPPADQDTVVFSFLMVSGFATMGKDEAKKELEALGKACGLKEEKDAPQLNMGDEKAMKEAATKMLVGVDKGKLFGSLIGFLEKHADKKMSFKDSISGELKDLKVEGDKASAKVNDKPVHFAKIGDAWYMAMK